MTEAQMKKKMAKIENRMEQLGEEIKEVDPIHSRSFRWLIISVLGYISGLIMLSYNPLASLLIIVAAVIAYSLHRSYVKEADTYLKSLADESAKLAKEHLHLRVRSDPDGFIRSVLEGTLDD